MNKLKILCVDDDPKILFLLNETLKSEFFVHTESNPKKAIDILKKESFDLLITDIKMPELNGIDMVKRVRKNNKDIIIIIITGFSTIENAIEAIKAGADEYLNKPIKPFSLLRLVNRLIKERTLIEENIKLRSELNRRYSFDNFITCDKNINIIFKKLEHVINTDTTILITGESGTGKDLLARLIHYNSNRKNKPFITFNISARPENLIESELFGYKKGSFTGALSDKKGAIAEANNGTLFLDEIGDLKLDIQIKLLQFIQYKTYKPIGGKEQKADIRIIAATNKNLLQLIKEGKFREDLYYRLNIVNFHIPALRERPEDIYLLTHHFLNQFSSKYKKKLRLSPECYKKLESYNWPGNVRQLKNYIEQLVIFADKEFLDNIDIDIDININIMDNIYKDWPTLNELEKRYIQIVLKHTNGNKNKAAKLLDIDPSTLWRKLKNITL